VFDGSFRNGVDKVTSPIGSTLAKLHVSADALTSAGLVLSVGAAFAIASGHFLLAFVAVVFAGLPDLLDGPVAKATGTSSKRGAFFDSFSDRVSDLLLFGSLGWYYLDRGDRAMAIVGFSIYGVASLISYQRAKAESLGFNAKGGLLERAERVFLLGAGLLFSFALSWIAVFILAASVVTAVQRFVKIWRQGSTTTAARSLRADARLHAGRVRRQRRVSAQRRSTERLRGKLASSSSAGRYRAMTSSGLIRKFREGPSGS
jgi:CDP-diacylglycerol--glycerol-3-phosphate 3-phosphatidyltransferase